jgi:hypothetical protein
LDAFFITSRQAQVLKPKAISPRTLNLVPEI